MRPLPQSGGAAPLSNRQKAYLSGLAKTAWRILSQGGGTDEKEQEYRQREAISCCGRRISEARNGDFSDLEAHFLALAGKSGRAFDSAMKADSNPARQALFKLRKLLQKQGRAEDYAAKILRDKYKTTLTEATAKQLWSVYFDCQRTFRSTQGKSGGSASALMTRAAARWSGNDDTSIPF